NFFALHMIALGFICLGLACSPPMSETPSFSGEAAAVDLADRMFEAIGGKDAWCALRSLYIKAEHTEPDMDQPYQSEIWRGIDTFDLIIEQQNADFHVKGIFSDARAEIRYLDERDSSRVLTADQRSAWRFDHEHNVYLLLHDLACNPQLYNVVREADQYLAFYRDSVFVTGFGLDQQLRPERFHRPNPDGSISESMFTHWGSDGGLVHSAGGHPLDSSFFYLTEIWQPSRLTLLEAFGQEVYEWRR
ncbi:MAG: hypothetical protein R3330_19365, partial [Saprospiraceae bacterium]|nr:hypothetical protein [Saprospiraceae bacterium]